ncbi:hypothetical protein FB446DRAFT_226392 [Lentinula raphanica]|nr:hypothetical protein FB446DRAFT_226392 [Lentinula raphanica]
MHRFNVLFIAAAACTLLAGCPDSIASPVVIGRASTDAEPGASSSTVHSLVTSKVQHRIGWEIWGATPEGPSSYQILVQDQHMTMTHSFNRLLEGGVYYRLKNNLAMSDPNTFSVRTLEAKFDSPFDGDKEKKALYDHVPMAFTKCEWIIDGLDYWYRRSHDGQSLHESNKAALRFAITQVEEAERLTLTCGRE